MSDHRLRGSLRRALHQVEARVGRRSAPAAVDEPVVAEPAAPVEPAVAVEPAVVVEPTLAERLPADLIADVRPDLSGKQYIRAHELPESGPYPWLDQPDWADELDRRSAAGELDDTTRELCVRFATDGYAVVPGVLSSDECDQVWDAYLRGVADGVVAPSPEKMGDDDPHPGHVMNAHIELPEVRAAASNPQLMALVDTLLGVDPILFQTLLFPKGRGQLEHSDTIHMTTYPHGYMCAAWIALEDIDPDAGPLCYYPGSHRLPRIYGSDVDLSPERFADELYGAVAERYEPAVQQLLVRSGIEKQVFLPRKGDVLIWHDNLIHGGTPRTDVRPSRKSLVCHYFGRGALCYHDLSGKIADRVYDPEPVTT